MNQWYFPIIIGLLGVVPTVGYGVFQTMANIETDVVISDKKREVEYKKAFISAEADIKNARAINMLSDQQESWRIAGYYFKDGVLPNLSLDDYNKMVADSPNSIVYLFDINGLCIGYAEKDTNLVFIGETDKVRRESAMIKCKNRKIRKKNERSKYATK
ncbi:MAG: hypothetical protein F6K26_18490 [Moorea sp. SIO2I5]|nr:hypothetical protein [Moorena sp. SIO2I5]